MFPTNQTVDGGWAITLLSLSLSNASPWLDSSLHAGIPLMISWKKIKVFPGMGKVETFFYFLFLLLFIEACCVYAFMYHDVGWGSFFTFVL